MAEAYDLVVHSHLRWDGVFQRPHHVISRLSKQHRVAFIEEPLFLESGDPGTHAVGDGAPLPASGVRLESRLEPPNVTVVQTFLPPQEEFLPAVSRENQALNRKLVEEFLARGGYQDGVCWHYAPMALYLAGACTERAVVYDCMDE